MKKPFFVSLLSGLLVAFLMVADIGAQTVTRGKLGKDDLSLWDGTAGTSKFSRQTPDGYSLLLNKFDWVGVDVFQQYGGGVSRSVAAILSAVSDIGRSQNADLWLSPGTWTITSGATIYENIGLIIPSGVSMIFSPGVTLWLSGPLRIGDYPVFDCSASGATVILLDSAVSGFVSRKWWNKNWHEYGLGKVPDDSAKLNINGQINGTTIYGIHTGSIASSVTFPDPMTSGVSTDQVTTGGIFAVNLTSSETLSGATVFGACLSNLNASSEVTGTVTPLSPNMSFSFETADVTPWVIQFNAADEVRGIANFATGASVIYIQGIAGSAYGYVRYLAPNKWIISGASVTTRNK